MKIFSAVNKISVMKILTLSSNDFGAGANLCECQVLVMEGKLVNMPVYLIVSSRSVACNYIIKTELRHRRQTFNLLGDCLQLYRSSVVMETHQ